MNARQTRFVQEYLIDHNATRAARRSGYSAKSARFIGAENLTKPNIAAAIATAQAERAERLRVTADEVMLQLRKYGFSSMRDYFDEEGRLLEPQELTPDAAVGLSAVKVLRGECPTGSRKSAATVNTSYPTFCISATLSSSRSRCAFSIQRCS